jgi:hypothetical protein
MNVGDRRDLFFHHLLLGSLACRWTVEIRIFLIELDSASLEIPGKHEYVYQEN